MDSLTDGTASFITINDDDDDDDDTTYDDRRRTAAVTYVYRLF